MIQNRAVFKNAETKRMTSIVWKLHWNWIGRKMGIYFGFDVLLFFILSVGWIYEQEVACLGEFNSAYRRSFSKTDLIQDLCYQVQTKGGELLLELPVYRPLKIIGIIILVVTIFFLIDICLSYLEEERQIRSILAPINEIALKADELSRMTFTEDKYQQIEEAISHLQPEEAELLSFGDADLQGIEAAMNNLLIRMRDSYRQQARFVNDASHELRTPIAVIQGYANMLARWGKEDEKVLEESIAAIQHESEHMKYLVEQLLFLVRGDSGKTRLEMKMISLNRLMQEVYEESLMIDENHVYHYKEANEEIQIKADEALLKQAVRILADNAAKYTRVGDEIVFAVGKSSNGETWLQIQDTGIGMAETDVKHIFERFYRADEARQYQGTGLGLSIAKWIVDKHKGHFEILSRTQLGTRIRIILP